LTNSPLHHIPPNSIRENVGGSFDHRRKEMHHDGVSLFGQFLYTFLSFLYIKRALQYSYMVYSVQLRALIIIVINAQCWEKCCCCNGRFTPDLICATRECCCNSCSCWPANQPLLFSSYYVE
jgi:hypothetical protein